MARNKISGRDVTEQFPFVSSSATSRAKHVDKKKKEHDLVS